MSRLANYSRQARLVAKASLLALCGLGASAHAALIGLTGDAINVNLYSDATTVAAGDTGLVVSALTEISSSNLPSSNIGGSGNLLPGLGGTDGEAIDLRSFSFVLRLLAGGGGNGSPLVTGWGAGARYVFSDLNLNAADNLEIYGVSAASTGGTISNFSASWAKFISPTEISFDVEAIVFGQATSGTTFGEVTLTLLTRTPVVVEPPTPGLPEPGTMVLSGLALVALMASRRRSARR